MLRLGPPRKSEFQRPLNFPPSAEYYLGTLHCFEWSLPQFTKILFFWGPDYFASHFGEPCGRQFSYGECWWVLGSEDCGLKLWLLWGKEEELWTEELWNSTHDQSRCSRLSHFGNDLGRSKIQAWKVSRYFIAASDAWCTFWGILVACPHLGLTENPEGGLIPNGPDLPFPWFFVFFQVLERDGLRIQPPTTEIYLKEKPPPRNFIEKQCWKGLEWVKSSIMQCWYFLIDLILTRITYILQ